MIDGFGKKLNLSYQIKVHKASKNLVDQVNVISDDKKNVKGN